MLDSYLTIAGRHQSDLKIERSRFIATVIPVQSREKADEEYRTVQANYHDATHNCFAYQIGVGTNLRFRYADDGEPSGTAGKPIYDSIRSHNLTDLLLVVTRYFGGVKLGTGDLARAYRDSARQVLAQAEIVERFIRQHFRISFDHQETAVVMKILSEYGLKPLKTDYGDKVDIDCAIRLSRYEAICRDLVERSHGRVVIAKV